MKNLIDSTLFELNKNRISSLLTMTIKDCIKSYSKYHVFVSESTYPYIHRGCAIIKKNSGYDVYDFYYDYISDKIMDFKVSHEGLTYEESFKYTLKNCFVQI